MLGHALLAAIGVLVTTVGATNIRTGLPTASISDMVTPRRLLLVNDLSCVIYLNVDYAYQGYDIANVPGATPTDCCAKCAVKTGCQVFTWTNWNGGTCWLKSGTGTLVEVPGAASSYVWPSSSKGLTCAFESAIDYVGNDIGSLHTDSADECCAKCSQRAGCGAFTWTNDNGGVCYLKSGKGTTRRGNFYSGTVQTPNCPTIETNVDYAGNDIGNIAGAGASDCCAKCVQTAGCGAFTWTNWNGGTCWLKSGKGSSSGSLGAVSAVVG